MTDYVPLNFWRILARMVKPSSRKYHSLYDNPSFSTAKKIKVKWHEKKWIHIHIHK
jgi:hypothetical protein